MQKTKPIAIGGLGIIATANCEFLSSLAIFAADALLC